MLFRAANGLMAPELMRELDIAPARMGFVGGIFFLTFGLAMIPAGVALDRFGPRATISALSMLGVAGCAIFATADGWLGLAAGRAVLALACVGTLMGSVATLSRWAPPREVALHVATVNAAGGVGNMLATAPLAYAIEAVGWRGAYWGLGGVCIAIAAVMWFGTRDRPDGRPLESGRENLGDVLRGLKAVFAHRFLLPFMAVQAVIYPSHAALVGLWGGPFLSDVYGLGLAERGWVLLGMTAIGVPFSIWIGTLDARFGTRTGVVLAVGGAMILALAPLALWGGWPLWAAVALLCAFSTTGGVIAILHTHVRFSFPEQLAGRGLATLNAAVMAGAYVMQQATGVIVEAIRGSASVAPPLAYQAVFGWLVVSIALGLLFYRRVPDVRPS